MRPLDVASLPGSLTALRSLGRGAGEARDVEPKGRVSRPGSGKARDMARRSFWAWQWREVTWRTQECFMGLMTISSEHMDPRLPNAWKL